jgi:branched-chain amino acid transport system substrate-binding protein
MTRAIRALSVALAIVFAAGASSAQAQDSVKVGVIQPLSGPVAASGNYVRMGAEIARDWINAKGGVLGRKVELLIEDNKSDPKEAATAAEKLIVRDKVPVIVGAWGSSMTLAAMPKLAEYGVPMVVETSSAATITKQGNPWVFRISPPSEMEALGLEKYLKEFGIKQADFLAVNTDWGRGSVTAFGDLLKRSGASVGAVEFMDQSATDRRPDHQGEAGSDTLFLTTSVEQITLVLEQAQAQRSSPAGHHHRRQLPPAHQAGGQRPRRLVPHLPFLPWFPEAMLTASSRRPSSTSGPSAATRSRG